MEQGSGRRLIGVRVVVAQNELHGYVGADLFKIFPQQFKLFYRLDLLFAVGNMPETLRSVAYKIAGNDEEFRAGLHRVEFWDNGPDAFNFGVVWITRSNKHKAIFRTGVETSGGVGIGESFVELCPFGTMALACKQAHQ